MRYITKTSKQANENQKYDNDKDNTCPECGKANLGLIITKEPFFFFSSYKLMNKYTCRGCGCEWNTGWRKV